MISCIWYSTWYHFKHHAWYRYTCLWYHDPKPFLVPPEMSKIHDIPPYIMKFLWYQLATNLRMLVELRKIWLHLANTSYHEVFTSILGDSGDLLSMCRTRSDIGELILTAASCSAQSTASLSTGLFGRTTVAIFFWDILHRGDLVTCIAAAL